MKDKVVSFFSNYPALYYRKGERILRPNEYSEFRYYVEEGQVKIYKILQTGQEISYNCLNPQKQKYIIFGYTKLLKDFYIEAITDVTIRRCSQDDFYGFTTKNPEIKDIIIIDLLAVLEETFSQIEWLAIPDAYTRIKLVLYALCRDNKYTTSNDKDETCSLKITQNELANLSGLTRETVSKQISRLIAEEYLCRDDSHIIIHTLEELVKDSK
jgi:CRP-like cAMP-binding protein